MSTVATVARNSAFIFLGQVAARIFSLSTVVLIARGLGEAGFGEYIHILAVVGLFALVADFRLSIVLTREVARQREAAGSYLRTVLTLKVALGVVSALLARLTVSLLPLGGEARTSFYVAVAAILIGTLVETFNAVFQAFERMEFVALTSVVNVGLVFLNALLVMLNRWGLLALWWGYFVANALTALLAGWLVRRRFAPVSFAWPLDKSLSRLFLWEAWPFFLSALFGLVHFRADVIILRQTQGETVVGWYGTAYRLTEALIAAHAAFLTAIFPVFSRFAVSTEEGLRLGYRKSLQYFLLLGLPLGVGVCLLAQPLVRLLFGREFAPGGQAMQLLIWVAVLSFLNGVMYTVLNATNRQRQTTVVFGAAMVFNVALNLLLIPRWGMLGASATKVASEVLSAGLALRFVSQRVGRLTGGLLSAKPWLAIAFMGGVIWLLRGWSWVGAGLIGGAIYLAVLLLLRTFDETDRRICQQLWGVKRQRP